MCDIAPCHRLDTFSFGLLTAPSLISTSTSLAVVAGFSMRSGHLRLAAGDS